MDYDIPSTYNFENVDYSGQQDRLAMMTEMKAYMSTAVNPGTMVTAERLKAMFSNSPDANFNQVYSKQLEDKTFSNVRTDFYQLFEELASASQSTVPGTAGVAGVVKSLDNSKAYLLGPKGLDHAQIIEKGLMGACFYYQATSVYLGPDKMNVDNSVVEDGKGTAMQHHWDEAFGYFGVQTDFPNNLNGLYFWGAYSNSRNEILGCNEKLMGALIEGRAAIDHNDLNARDKAIDKVRTEWEKIGVASAIHYLNVAIDQFDDMAIRAHVLSEAIGFVFGLQFNLEKTMSNQEIVNVLSLIGGHDSFDLMNLYELKIEDLESAKQMLAEAHDMNDIKDSL